MKKSGAFFSIQKSQIFPSTPNTYKKTSFGPLFTAYFLFLLLKGTKKWGLIRFKAKFLI